METGAQTDCFRLRNTGPSAVPSNRFLNRISVGALWMEEKLRIS
jgi:hypothetical protein